MHRESKGLFSELKPRDLVLPNRIAVSRMCQYSANCAYLTGSGNERELEGTASLCP